MPEISETFYNLPAPLDVHSLDLTERWVVAGILTADAAFATATIAGLRGEDFESPALEAIVRSADRTLRAHRPTTIMNVTTSAVENGLIRHQHATYFEKLLHDVIEDSLGDLGCFHAPLLVYRSCLRRLLAISDRAEQVREIYGVDGGWWFGHGDFESAGHAIAVATDVADTLDALGGQLHDAAARLRADVAPRQQRTAQRLATPKAIIRHREEVAA